MSRRRRENRDRKSNPADASQRKSIRRLIPYGVVFALGAALTFGIVTLSSSADARDEPRTVAQLLALSDDQLEKVDVVELNLAVAREIPGLEDLDIAKYQQLVDEWADKIARHLSTTQRSGFSQDA